MANLVLDRAEVNLQSGLSEKSPADGPIAGVGPNLRA
jgi:hypothetical protein